MRRLTRGQLRAVKDPQWKVVSHGIDHNQFYVPMGTFLSDWVEAITGIGDTPFAAMEDALDCAGCDGYNVDHIPNTLEDKGEDLPEDNYYYVTLLLR